MAFVIGSYFLYWCLKKILLPYKIMLHKYYVTFVLVDSLLQEIVVNSRLYSLIGDTICMA